MGEAKRRGSKEQRVAEGIVKREAKRRRREEENLALMAARQAAREEQVRRRKEREEENRKWREDRLKAGHPVGPIRNYSRLGGGMGLSAATMVALAAGSAYGMMPYERRHKLDKGKKGGSCNREVCQRPGAYWHNAGNDKYYCGNCAHLINQNAPLCTNEAPDHD